MKRLSRVLATTMAATFIDAISADDSFLPDDINDKESYEENTTHRAPEDDSFFNYLFNVASVFLILLTIVGIAGNSLVAYVILANKPMRNVTNLLLLNLSFADIAFLFFCGPSDAYKYVSHQWSFGNLACQVIQYVLYVTVYVTIYTLVAISAYRYVTIVRGVKSQVSVIFEGLSQRLSMILHYI